ncbi:MAG: carboxypeptidase-like regulatory domain-containing protein, partial [Candidatus Hydrogenedentota bacterium]
SGGEGEISGSVNSDCVALVVRRDGVVVATAVADANREFGFPLLPAGAGYEIETYAPGFDGEIIEFDLIAGTPFDPEIELEELSDQTGAVFGLVTDSVTGLPLGGVRVDALVGGSMVARTYTCASGSYELFLPAKISKGTVEVTLEFFASQFEPAEIVLEIDPDDVDGAEVDFELVRKFTFPGGVTGTITDGGTGDPIEGAQVIISTDQDHYIVFTDVSGIYSFPGIESGDYTVRVAADGLSGTAMISVTSGDLTVVDVEVEDPVGGEGEGEGEGEGCAADNGNPRQSSPVGDLIALALSLGLVAKDRKSFVPIQNM